MFEVIFLFVLGLVWIIFAVVQDIKEREVADWLNFSLIIFALGFRFFYSLFFGEGFDFFYQGLIGLGVFFAIGNFLYYGKMFAGGDAKLMIALGTVLPLFDDFKSNLEFSASFLILFFISGAFYSLSASFVLSLKNFKKFKKEFLSQFSKNKKLAFSSIFAAVVFAVIGFYQSTFLILGILIFIFPYLYIYAKSVDESCMIRKLDVRNLREGDWLYKDLKVGSKILKAKWRGLNKKEINLLQRNKKYVEIREGIPFTPAFLISFVLLFVLFWSGLWNSFW